MSSKCGKYILVLLFSTLQTRVWSLHYLFFLTKSLHYLKVSFLKFIDSFLLGLKKKNRMWTNPLIMCTNLVFGCALVHRSWTTAVVVGPTWMGTTCPTCTRGKQLWVRIHWCQCTLSISFIIQRRQWAYLLTTFIQRQRGILPQCQQASCPNPHPSFLTQVRHMVTWLSLPQSMLNCKLTVF